jgi:hypothetical protein
MRVGKLRAGRPHTCELEIETIQGDYGSVSAYLHGGKALAGKVGSVASRRYVEQVEWQRQPRACNRNRLCKRHLQTMSWFWVLVCFGIPLTAVALDKLLGTAPLREPKKEE